MAKRQKITIKGQEISFYIEDRSNYVSLTDIAKSTGKRPDSILQNWMRSSSVIDFLGTWEELHNDDFNSIIFNKIKLESTAAAYTISVKEWVGQTDAIGIVSRQGRGGGTYAHMDIAIQFCSYLSPTFYVYLIKEFNRLKEEEALRLRSEWNVKRIMTKANYYIQTDAIRRFLVPVIDWNTKREGIYMASEADVLNVALFGMTANQWKKANPEKKGNIRDHCSVEQLQVLANIEVLNAELIKEGLSQDERLVRLNQAAIQHMDILINHPALNDIRADMNKRLGSSPEK
jgi:hypothetical protein